MEEKKLLKLSLICSLIGLFIILVIANKLEIKIIPIKDITKKQIDQQVKITGQIISLKETPGLIILRVKDNTASIPVVIFKEENTTLKQNSFIEIQGKVIEYKNQLEIQADSIKEI